MLNKEVTHTQVGQFYDSSVITRFWSRLKHKQMHVGYWDEEHPYKEDLYEGAKRFTDVMISYTNIKEHESFIDIGCGYGVPAVTLAQRKKCRVFGVTASKKQCEDARELAASNDLEEQVTFQVADANHLPFTANVFDGGWFFESIFHIGHETALREAGRVLKPKAELIIADFVKTVELTAGEIEFLRDDIGIKSLVSMRDYRDLLGRTGFNMTELKDITENTLEAEKKWRVHLDIIENQIKGTADYDDPKAYAYLKSFFTKLHEIGKRAIGYCVVKAEKK